MNHSKIQFMDGKANYIYGLLSGHNHRLDLLDLEVENVSGDKFSVPLTAWVTVEGDSFFLHIRKTSKQKIDERLECFFNTFKESGFVGSEDCVEFRARTENNAIVVLEGVFPQPIERHSCDSIIEVARFSFWGLSIEPVRLDALDRDGKERYFQSLKKERDLDDSNYLPSEYEAKDNFMAILPKVELLVASCEKRITVDHPFNGEQFSKDSDCFCGEAIGGRFCLEQVGEDIHVYFERVVGDISEERALADFDGVLQVVGLIHGCHPWPSYKRYSRNTRRVSEWIAPRSSIKRDILLPLGNHKMFVHDNMDAVSLFPKAIEFFSNASDDTKAVVNALWLMRESCHKGIAKEVSLLTLCSIFEGFVAKYIGRKPKRVKSEGEYDQYKWIRPIEDHYNLPYEWFSPAVESFKTFRNNLAHGFDFGENQKKSFGLLKAYSRLISAIYMLVFRKMGYTGKIKISQLEGLGLADFGKTPKNVKKEC